MHHLCPFLGKCATISWVLESIQTMAPIFKHFQELGIYLMPVHKRWIIYLPWLHDSWKCMAKILNQGDNGDATENHCQWITWHDLLLNNQLCLVAITVEGKPVAFWEHVVHCPEHCYLAELFESIHCICHLIIATKYLCSHKSMHWVRQFLMLIAFCKKSLLQTQDGLLSSMSPL